MPQVSFDIFPLWAGLATKFFNLGWFSRPRGGGNTIKYYFFEVFYLMFRRCIDNLSYSLAWALLICGLLATWHCNSKHYKSVKRLHKYKHKVFYVSLADSKHSILHFVWRKLHPKERKHWNKVICWFINFPILKMLR